MQSNDCLSGCLGFLITLIVLGIAFLTVSLIVLAMAAIGYAIYSIVRWLTTPQPRLFGAWPMSRWTMSYEHGLFLLENNSGIDFNSTPMRILSGSLVLTLVPLILLNWTIALFVVFPPWVLPMVGLLLGTGTGAFLSQPPTNWFVWDGSTTGMLLDAPELFLPEDLALLDMMNSDQDW